MNVQVEINCSEQDDSGFPGPLKDSPSRPFSVDFLLAPGFSMLSLSAALEPLRRANSAAGKQLFRFRTLSWSGSNVASAGGQEIVVAGAVDRELAADLTLVCAGDAQEINFPPQISDHIRKLWRCGKTVGGMSGGVFALARAGILSGRKFTVHWEHKPLFGVRFPGLEACDDIYCIDERIMTCGGEMASADMMLDLIFKVCGASVGQGAMDQCLMSSKRFGCDDQTSTTAARFGVRNKHLLRAVTWIEENFHAEDGVAGMYRAIDISPRQVQRLFKVYVGQSPLQYMMEVRLKHARSLVAETDLSVGEIAMISGFECASHFSRSFKKKFGLTPYKYSNFFGSTKKPLLLPPALPR